MNQAVSSYLKTKGPSICEYVKKNEEITFRKISSLGDLLSVIASFNIIDSLLQMYHKLAFISARHK